MSVTQSCLRRANQSSRSFLGALISLSDPPERETGLPPSLHNNFTANYLGCDSPSRGQMDRF